MTTYILNADDAALDGWTLTALTAALRPALASLGVTVEAHPQESGLGGLQSDDADLRDQVRAIVERVVSSTPDELASRTAAARTLGSTRSPRKAAAVRANGRRGGRPVVLGTISAGAGRATVAWHPGRQRIGVRSEA